MKTLEELNKASADYIRRHWDNGGSSEFDHSINEISREKIEVFHALHGRIWLVKVNRYDDKEKAEPFLVEYTGQRIYNFSFSFAVPIYDQTLIDLLSEYEKPATPVNGKMVREQIDKIFNRADVLGAAFLQWS